MLLRTLTSLAFVSHLLADRKTERSSLSLSEIHTLGITKHTTAEDCTRCAHQGKIEGKKLSSHQFDRCTVDKQAVTDATVPRCQDLLCVTGIFGAKNEVDKKFTSSCLRTWSQTEYIEAAKTKATDEAAKADPPQTVPSGEDFFILLDSTDGQDKLLKDTKSVSSFFRMVRYFKSQKWWSFCGVTSMVMALNYLTVPPPVYMGVFRWWSEAKLLDLYPKIKENIDLHPPGTSVGELTCVLKDLGVSVEDTSKDAVNAAEFIATVKAATSSDEYQRTIILANYHRNFVGQTGSGHWSPVAAITEDGEWVLIMEVARIKFPPHWVRTSHLVAGMAQRGYLKLTYDPQSGDSLNLKIQGQSHLKQCAATCDGCTPDDAGLSIAEVKEVMTTPKESA